jgi:serine/threonine-protein kinase
MSMSSGTRLGPYEIVGAIGAGGMGEVYKARDTRLDRSVAIKVLPDSLASDPQFRERFDREARAISQLTHPHICTLYDVGEGVGTAFLVMEYLEGETLEQRLGKRAIPLDEALQIAIQIADALSVAHRRGIVHRDLKPGNVMLTKSGAKLLDFGLAKTGGADPSAAGVSMLATTPASLTERGAILGTFQYMAPEQLEGQDADARSDIFAFGALLYELVSGRKAFEGRSRASLIAAILEHDPPPLASLQPLAPSSLDHIVAKCLAKNPDDRWQSARDVTTELKWLASRHETPTASATLPTGLSSRKSRVPIVMAMAAALGLGAVAAVLAMKWRADGSSGEVVRSIVTTVPAERLLAFPTDETTNEGRPSRTSMAWSPDGQSVVFSASLGGRQQLYVRALNKLEATPIAGTEGASNPFFSPDGQWIGFATERALRKGAVSGGPATTIVDLNDTMYGASWGDDGSIVYSLDRQGLWRVGAAGGTPERVTQPDRKKGELKHLLPHVLPGSRAVLFTVTHTPLPKWDDTEVVVQELANGSRRTLVKAAADGRYAASGHVVYLQRGTMMAAPFDLGSLTVTGAGISVVAGVMQSAVTTNEFFDSGAGQFAISAAGSLLYVAGGIFPDPERTPVWVSRAGAEEPLPMPVRPYANPRLSPDGTRVTLWTQGDRNVWIYDLARRSLTRVNVDGRNARALWAPDGKRIAFSSTVDGPEENPYLISADGSGTPERIAICDCQSMAASSTPDGRALVAVEWNDSNVNYDIVLVDVAGTHHKTPLLHGKAGEQYPDVSPDGHWIAYVSDESGKSEVYVQPVPGLGSRHQISPDGGTAPAWSRDGRELFYTTTETFGGQATLTRMMAVAVATAPSFVASPPRLLFEGRYGATGVVRPYDVSLDGQRFLMVKQKERAPVSASQMILVQNWLEELKARVPK